MASSLMHSCSYRGNAALKYVSVVRETLSVCPQCRDQLCGIGYISTLWKKGGSGREMEWERRRGKRWGYVGEWKGGSGRKGGRMEGERDGGREEMREEREGRQGYSSGESEEGEREGSQGDEQREGEREKEGEEERIRGKLQDH